MLLFSDLVMSDFWPPHGLPQPRFPYTSPSPGVCSNSHPLSQWCHPTILSSVVPFSFCNQSFPASGAFPMSQLYASGGQSIGASASIFLMNIQGWFPLQLTGLFYLQSKGLSRVFSNTTVQKHQFFNVQLSLWSNISHDYWKNYSFDSTDLCWQSMSLLFNTLSRFVTTFLPRSKSFNFMAAVTICSDFGPQDNKVCHCFHCCPIYLPWSNGTGCHDLSFLNVEF